MHIFAEKNKNMKYLLTAFCALLLFSCSDDNKSDKTNVADRTVIIYISGENSLSSFAPSDLQEMEEASKKLNGKQRLVVFFDNSNTTEFPYIAELKEGKVVVNNNKRFAEDFYASDPERMRDILSYIMTAYPAGSYAIDLWGHSSGWVIANDSVAAADAGSVAAANRAYGIDNGKNTTYDYGKWMNIPSMAKVFSSLPQRFTYIMADCCLFQCVETAYELKDCTDYIIASPSEVPGDGAAYREVIPLMFNTSDNFYIAIADKWVEYAKNGNDSLPISVVKTSEMERFAAATAKIMPDLLQYDNFAGKRLVHYGVFTDGAYRKGYYDPKNLVLEYAADNPYRQEWEDALNAMIPYSVQCGKWLSNQERYGLNFSSFDVNDQTFSGVSMFVPQPMYESLNPNPNATIRQFKWAKAVGL